MSTSLGDRWDSANSQAKMLPQGTLHPVQFSATDSADFIGLQGISFIVKLPKSVEIKHRRIYVGVGRFIGDKIGDPYYEPVWTEQYMEKTQNWLIDLGVLEDIFYASHPRAVLTIRCSSIDQKKVILVQQRELRWPRQVACKRPVYFSLQSHPNRKVQAGVNIPLATWCARSSVSTEGMDSNPVQTLFGDKIFIRFQFSSPG